MGEPFLSLCQPVKVKIPILSHRTREGRGTREIVSSSAFRASEAGYRYGFGSLLSTYLFRTRLLLERLLSLQD
jgi:hypothetical protein